MYNYIDKWDKILYNGIKIKVTETEAEAMTNEQIIKELTTENPDLLPELIKEFTETEVKRYGK